MIEPSRHANIKRRAWRYKKPRLPAITSLFKTPAERRVFLREWLVKPVGYLRDLLAHFALKLLPIDVCSNLGALLGSIVVKNKHKTIVENMRRNLEIILPDASLSDREAIVTRNCENLGRLMTEFSVLTRICKSQERIEITGMDGVVKAAQKHPILVVALHLGNWEVVSSISTKFNTSWHSFYLPLNNPVERWVTTSVRNKLGLNLLPEGMAAVKPALDVLKKNGVVMLFCDEGFAGEIRGPLFHRRAHLRGNLALATRLARKTGAKLCVYHTERLHAANFKCNFSPIIELPEGHDAKKQSNLLADVHFLNGFIEPVIKNHLDQWYYLQDKL